VKGNVVRLQRRLKSLDAAKPTDALPLKRRLSPVVGWLVALTAVGVVGVGYFLMESPWPIDTTLRHWLAAPNCTAARAMQLAPAQRGAPGYYLRHDADRDGTACEPWPEHPVWRGDAFAAPPRRAAPTLVASSDASDSKPPLALASTREH
jgi:hypothetical protein